MKTADLFKSFLLFMVQELTGHLGSIKIKDQRVLQINRQKNNGINHKYIPLHPKTMNNEGLNPYKYGL